MRIYRKRIRALSVAQDRANEFGMTYAVFGCAGDFIVAPAHSHNQGGFPWPGGRERWQELDRLQPDALRTKYWSLTRREEE